MSNSVRPHRRRPAKLPRPWCSPGKNTGVGCHFLLQCMKVKSESEVTQSCLTPSDPMDCSLSGSSVHGIFQARVLECPLFHTGDHSPIASSGPHPVLELLCGVGGARVDSMEYRPWQFQACNLFFCFLILSNKNVFTFRRNESILLSKPPFSI